MKSSQIIPDRQYLLEIIMMYAGMLIKRDSSSIRNAVGKSLSIRVISANYKLRKKLHFSKMILHNGKFYSSLAVPGIPSEAYANSERNGVFNLLDERINKPRQIDTALLAITSNCPLNCSHCYEKANINSYISLTNDDWVETVRLLQEDGCGVIVLTGGEPLSDFERLLTILKSGDKNLSDFHIHTSGMTVTEEKVVQLKEAGLTAAGVGIDHYDESKNDRLRGKGSWKSALKAIDLFVKHDILTYVNFCAVKEIANESGLMKYAEFVRDRGVALIELLEPRECGGFKGEPSVLLGSGEKSALLNFMKKINLDKDYLDYPVIYYLAHLEGKEGLGCLMGGISHFYIDSAGNINPCVFMPVTFGNILKEDIRVILSRMRENIPYPLKTDCPAIAISKEVAADESHPVPFERVAGKFKELFR